MSTAAQAGIIFPPLWKAAEEKSAEQQRQFYLALAAQLVALSVGALLALIPSDSCLGAAGPVLTLLFFLAAFGIQVSGVAARAEQRWYDARAAAESIRSAAWQFAVGGEAFRLDDTQASTRFTELLSDVLKTLKSLDIGSASASSASVTDSMDRLRHAPLEERQAVYFRDRIQDQVDWYAAKAKWNKSRARWFGLAVVVIESAAIVLGLLRVIGVSDADWLGVAAAAAAGFIGWSQAKKYALLAESYGVTSHEVGLTASYLNRSAVETGWSQSVHDAEAAFSREHTMWRARRQGPQ